MSGSTVVLGGGPAGLAAAKAIASAQGHCLLIDENPGLGGQVWRGHGIENPKGVEVLREHTVVYAEGKTLWLKSLDRLFGLTWDRLVLATGSRERFLPFPGWTLPGVVGVGALQALAKTGLDLRGKRTVIAGSGPLLLAVAHHASSAGADVLFIAEQAPLSQVSRFSLAAASDLTRLQQLAEMSRTLEPRLLGFGWWVSEARGSRRLEEVIITNGLAQRRLQVDCLAVSYGLVPNTDVARLLNLDVRKGAIVIDKSLRTSNPDIWAAGECVGIGGSDKAIAEGEAAGRAVCGQAVNPQQLDRHRTYARALEAAYRIRPEVRALARQDTIVCRCENTTFGELQTARSAHEAKLHTRCGMGACQGRVCGPIMETVWDWEQPSIRPPLIPIDLRSCISLGVSPYGNV